ncbi:hypothetical protein OIO90_001346 [Microbotryomycetes sp. JL221]|nr:hypothetical protein OIO90_001346 [Microbotryomycetes sp. JL221]
MAVTTTTQVKPPLIYSLPLKCPLAWPACPPYPIVSLDAFAQLVIKIASETPRAETSILLRELVTPLHDFDRRWRSAVPELVKPVNDTFNVDRSSDNELNMETEAHIAKPQLPKKSKKNAVSERQRQIFLNSVDLWRRDASRSKDESNRQATADRRSASATLEPNGTGANDTADANWSLDSTAHVNEWLTRTELYETRLQATLLLTLMAFPLDADASALAGVKQKKRSNPERHSSTLDPELLLDFLTDRLQIWRVMKDVGNIGFDSSEEKAQDPKDQEELDEVQSWWKDVVEHRYAAQVSEKTLSHHRAKLFPSQTTGDALSVRIEPEPSPFKARSLLSLDKSARQKERTENAYAVAQSPTMRRLVKLAGRQPGAQASEDVAEHEVFKIPSVVRQTDEHNDTKRLVGPEDTDMDVTGVVDKQAKSPPMRKQDRSKGLSRTQSMIAPSKALFNSRREVSLPRKPTAPALKRKAAGEEGEKKAVMRKEGEVRQRKNPSPKKLSSFSSHPLVLNTPAKPVAETADKLVARPATLPSFAALGAAFRPGASHNMGFTLPLGIPPAPRLPGDAIDPWEQDTTTISHPARQNLKRQNAVINDDEDELHLSSTSLTRPDEVTATPVSKRKFVIPDT